MAVTKDTLAREVAEVLELPFARRHGTAYKIIVSMFKSMSDALLRGEEIKIDGFGIFRLRERPPTRHGAVYHYHLKQRADSIVIELPAKKYITFIPSKPLKRFINNG